LILWVFFFPLSFSMHSYIKQGRSHSARSSYINTVNQKRKRSTWTCNPKRYSSYSANRIMRWRSQHYRKRTTSQSSLLSPQQVSIPLHHQILRNTMITISTLTSTTCSRAHCSRIQTQTNEDFYGEQIPDSIFHIQSLLFLFGFLFFPCWWIGGYYIKVDSSSDVEASPKSRITVHPSLLANGRTASRFFVELPVIEAANHNVAFVPWFYKWNRRMSLVSIILVMLVIGLLVWYFVQFY
jgi:hypothetical protein